MNSDEFLALESVTASKSGKKRSWVESRQEIQDDFRSESNLESRLGLLNSCVFFDGEEKELELGSFFLDPEQANPYMDGVLQVIERAEVLCRQPGSTLVRQHMRRDAENKISAKVFAPVATSKVAIRYAATAAKLVYFCTKAKWLNGPRTFTDAKDILQQILFEEHTNISQTFMTRSAHHRLSLLKLHTLIMNF